MDLALLYCALENAHCEVRAINYEYRTAAADISQQGRS
jgi:hypothetical protein